MEETKNRFQLTISNKCQVLASLQEKEEHLSEGKEQTAVNQLWQGIKDAWRETCEETLGRKSKQHRVYASVETLNKIVVRKKAKEVLNHSKMRVRKADARAKYSESNKEVKRSIRKDRRNFVDSLAKQAEELAGKGDMKKLYSITRTLAGVKKIPDRPFRAKSGELPTDQEEQRKRWADHFRKLLKRPPPSEIPEIAPADTLLEVNESKKGKEEVRHLKNGKAAGPDGILPDAIKADPETLAEMLYNLFGKIREKNTR